MYNEQDQLKGCIDVEFAAEVVKRTGSANEFLQWLEGSNARTGVYMPAVMKLIDQTGILGEKAVNETKHRVRFCIHNVVLTAPTHVSYNVGT